MRAAVFLLIGLASVMVLAAAQQKAVRLDDNSDWWSITKDDTFGTGAKILKVRPPEVNFRIAGIVLGIDPDHLRDRLGQAADVERGDASTGRDQVCYVSPSGDVHLIFEWGEVDSVVYLFAGGSPWKGQEHCVALNRLSTKLATDSGLKLGLTQQQVLAILSKPSLSNTDRLLYSYEYRMTTSREGLKKLRADNPQMNDSEFMKNFARIDVTALIDARFSQGELSYLAISRSETY